MPEKNIQEVSQPAINLYRRLVIILLVIGVFSVVALALIFQWKKDLYLHWGMLIVIKRIELQIPKMSTLPMEQKDELQRYLAALEQFVRSHTLDKKNIYRYYQLIGPIRRALLDEMITPQEINEIRKGVWQSNIFLETEPPASQPTPIKADQPSTGKK